MMVNGRRMADSGQQMLHAQDSATVTLGEALAWATRVLDEAGVDAPAREARLLAAHLLRRTVTPLTPAGTPLDRARFAALAARRAAREPLAYITGQRGFWTLDLAVNPDTLVPRADSETLVEAALAALPDRDAVVRILDLGTGSGCLLLAALSEFGRAFGVGVDLSPGAALAAARNARSCGLADRSAFVVGDWAAPLGSGFDLVLCNPPYIASADLPALMPEVARHEPHEALDGGPSGLDCYATLLPALPALLRPGGVAVLELGQGQSQDVAALAERAGLTQLATRQDLAGIARALVLGEAPA